MRLQVVHKYIVSLSARCHAEHEHSHLMWDFFERAAYIYWVNRTVLIGSPYNCQRGRL